MDQTSPKKKLTPPIIAGIVAGAVVLVLAGAYCGLCAWVSGNGRLLPGTVAQNTTQTVTLDLGGLTQEAAVEYMTNSMQDHMDELSLTLKYGEDQSVTISGSLLDVDPQAAVAFSLDDKKSRNFLTLGLAWLGAGSDPAPLSLSSSSFTPEGKKQVQEYIDQIAEALYVAPVDFRYELKDNALELTLGTDGAQVDKDALMKQITQALATGETSLTVETEAVPCAELTGEILSELVYQELYKIVKHGVSAEQKTFLYQYSNIMFEDDAEYDFGLLTDGYRKFVSHLRDIYPKAKIVLLSGSMLSGKPLDDVKRAMDTVVSERKQAGDSEVYRFDMSPQTGSLGYGANWHPSMRQQQKMANELTAYLKELMNW